MKITLLDTIPFDYDIDYPLHHPLGAGNSAICYLAKELARLGHSVSVFNGCKVPLDVHGIPVRNHAELNAGTGAEFLNAQDVAIVANGAIGNQLRQWGVKAPLVLWTQHAHDQPAVQALHKPLERYSWNAIVYVSNWQRKHYEHIFGMPPDKAVIIHNGVAPPFEIDIPVVPDFFGERWPFYYAGRPPVLAYTSTPFRGLMTLLSAFPRIRKAIPGTTLRVFSSMKVYQKSAEDDDFDVLYHACRTMEGVEYMGSLGQTKLAYEMSHVDVLTYPSTFAEGQCVSVGEAMAVGCAVFTTTLGALPEFYSGTATMTAWEGDGLVRRFANDVIDGLREMQSDPLRAMANRRRRIEFVRKKFHWPKIAHEWEYFLTRLTHPSTTTGTQKIAS